MSRFLAAIALPLAVLWGSAAHGADATDRFVRTIAAARAVRIDATIAEVTIVGSNRSDVSIEITRRAPKQDQLAQFPAVVEESSGRIHISAVQPDEQRDPNLKADIIVRAPASMPFEAVRVFEGRVRLSGLTSACDVDVRRGAVEATGVAGRIRLESGVGSVDVRDATLTPGGMLRARVFNGPLRVRFPQAPSNARILALTFNGTITSDIPLTMRDQFGPRFGETTIGTGDPVMSLDVVTGDISIGVDNSR